MPFQGKGVSSIKLLFYNRLISNNNTKPSSSILHKHFSTFSRGGRDREELNGSFYEDGDQNLDGFQNPPEPIPNRPLRGERRPSPPPPRCPPFKPDRNDGFGQIPRTPVQNRPRDDGFDRIPRTPVQNRPRGGEGRFEGSKFDMGLGNDDKVKSPLFRDSQFGKPKDGNKADLSFLEKFKLGEEKKPSLEQNGDAQVVESESKGAPEAPPEDADEIFKKMKETGMIPNAVAMLDGLCKDGLVQEAMKLFGLMREKGTIPEVVIYTAVVEGFCKALKFDDAKRIFRKMQSNGITPNAFSYTVLIQGMCKGKRLEDAVDFSVEMLEAKHSPNVATFANLIESICKEKGVEEAEGVIRRLREKEFFVNEKAVREHMDKKGPFSPLTWEAIFGKKSSQKMF